MYSFIQFLPFILLEVQIFFMPSSFAFIVVVFARSLLDTRNSISQHTSV